MNPDLEHQAATLAKKWSRLDVARLAIRNQEKARALHQENRALRAENALYRAREHQQGTTTQHPTQNATGGTK